MNCESCLLPVMMVKHKSQATDYSGITAKKAILGCNQFLLQGHCGYMVRVLDL